MTWYKDPPNAPAPGVYAAFTIACRYRNINLCQEVLVLHEQSDGRFLLMRQERNIIDKDTERKIREEQEKKPGT